MCVCVRLRVYNNVIQFLDTYTFTCTHTRTHTCTHTCKRACIYAFSCIHIHVFTRACTRAHPNVYTYVRVRTRLLNSRVLSGDRPLKLERRRGDEHGPCARKGAKFSLFFKARKIRDRSRARVRPVPSHIFRSAIV